MHHPGASSFVTRKPSEILPKDLEAFFKREPKRPFYDIRVLGSDCKKLSDEDVENLKDNDELYIIGRGLNLEGAYLLGKHKWCTADFRGANFRQANLRNARFCQTDCSGADFEGADMREIDLGTAGLSNSNLKCADMTDAFLNDADIYHANFEGAVLARASVHAKDFSPENNITKKQLYSAYWITDSESDMHSGEDEEESSDSE